MEKISEKFNELYKKYYTAVYKYFCRRVDTNDAEELAQQTFMKLWLWLIKLKTIKNEKSFIFTIAKNVLTDYFRLKRISQGNISIEDVFDLCDENDFRKETELNFIINRLSEKEQEIIRLKIEGYNSREIGKILGMFPSTVRSKIEKIRKYLKKDLE